MQLITSISDAQSGTFYDMADLRVSISFTTHKRKNVGFFSSRCSKNSPVTQLTLKINL